MKAYEWKIWIYLDLTLSAGHATLRGVCGTRHVALSRRFVSSALRLAACGELVLKFDLLLYSMISYGGEKCSHARCREVK